MARLIERIEDVQDLANLSEDLLSRLMEQIEGVSATMWILDQNQTFRNICSRGKGKRKRSIDPGEVIHRHEEISGGKPFFEQKEGRVVLNSVFLPIMYHDMLNALVHMELKTFKGTTVDDETLKAAKAIADDFSPFLQSALTLDRIKRNPLKDLDSDAYNEPFILDFLQRQVSASRRFHRRIGLVCLEFEGAESFQKGQSYRLVQAMLRDISETLQGIMRDFDVVSHVGSFRFLLGLPDTDSLGCRIAVERIRKGFEQLAFLGERFEKFALKPHFGFACFPEEGTEADDILTRALEKARDSRKDPFHDVAWGGSGFWQIVEHLTGAGRKKDLKGLTNTHPIEFSTGFTYLLQEAMANDIVLHPGRRGLLYIGTDNMLITEALLQRNAMITRSATQVSVFGDLTGIQALKALNINTISLPPERANAFQFILLLTDISAYGIMAVHQKGDSWAGFHTSHDKLVERMVFRLREEYSLQEQI